VANSGLQLGGQRLQTFAACHKVEDLLTGLLALPKISSYLPATITIVVPALSAT
jgi:hypothetical protein